MKYYYSYMDRQEVSSQVHEKLLNLEVPKRASRPWMKYGALAACAALIVGVGVWKLAPAPALAPAPVQGAGQFAADYEPLPGERDTVGPDDRFVVNSPAVYGAHFADMPIIHYQDATDSFQTAASRAYAPGSFFVELDKKDIQSIFWNLDGAEQGDLPWELSWDGYTLRGSAWYSGQGELTEVTLWGEKGRASFELELHKGAMPFSCVVDLNQGDKISEFNGVEITGWSKVYDQDGDGEDDYICASEFMMENGIGVRFTSRNSGIAELGVDWEAGFNTRFVHQALTGGLHLDHLATAERIPAWREESFTTLAQARQEAEFAPYLPTKEPEGYSEFYGRLSYQEGTQDMLFVRWSRVGAYDDVNVVVYQDYYNYHLVAPEETVRYDLRLYEIPWCDSVPEEYRETVDHPAFRAEDMSLSVVEARGREHDTGGMTYSFDVLHPDGTVVSYRCDGLTARQVWEMVEETL